MSPLPSLAALAGEGTWFEDFTPGQRFRHARGATVGEVENQALSKLVMNSAQAHWNEHAMASTPFGRRLVFGFITASVVIGLATQDTAERALAEVALTGVRFPAPVFHGDTLYAYTEVLGVADAPEHPDGGLVRFRHWGTNQDGTVVVEATRTVLVQRRSVWGVR